MLLKSCKSHLMEPSELTPNERGVISADELKNEWGVISADKLKNAILQNLPIQPIEWVEVEGNVEIHSADYRHKLTIRNTEFKGRFDLSEMYFSRSLDLKGCSFTENVNFSSAQIDGNLILANAKIESSSEEPPGSWELKSFEGTNVQGVLDARGLNASVVLNLNHSKIGKLLLCCSDQRRTECKEIRLVGARVRHQIDCSGIKVSKNFFLQSADIQCDLFCNLSGNYFAEVGGRMLLVGTKILGRADLSGIKVAGDLYADSAEIQGGLDFKPEKDENEQWHRTEISGEAYFGGIKISPLIDFRGTKICKDLSLEAAEIKGNVFCGYHPESAYSTQIAGEVDFTGIHVTKSVKLSGIEIAKDLKIKGGEIKEDLCCQACHWHLKSHELPIIWLLLLKNYCRVGTLASFLFLCSKPTVIKGNADLVEVKALGSVNFSGAQIGGNLDLKRAEIRSKLDCEVNKGNRTRIAKNTNLAGAKLFGNFNLSGTSIGKDLILKGTEIAGSIECDIQKTYPTEIGGRVNLNRARVLSSVNFRDAKISKNLDLVGANLSSKFFCNLGQIGGEANIKECDVHQVNVLCPHQSPAKLNLSFAKVVSLKIEETLPKRLNLEGFEFQHIELPETEEHPYIEFLKASKPFYKGVYLYVENWLRNQGKQIDANRVYVAMRRRNKNEKVSSGLNTRQGKLVLFVQQTVERFLDATTAYGTETYRLLFCYFVPVLIISSFLFCNDKSVQLDPSVAQGLRNLQSVREPPQPSMKLKDESPIFPDNWSGTEAFWLALKVSLPVVSISWTDRWVPSRQKIELLKGEIPIVHKPLELEIPITYRDYALLVTLLSWIAVPTFLAGISGIVKKRP